MAVRGRCRVVPRTCRQTRRLNCNWVPLGRVYKNTFISTRPLRRNAPKMWIQFWLVLPLVPLLSPIVKGRFDSLVTIQSALALILAFTYDTLLLHAHNPPTHPPPFYFGYFVEYSPLKQSSSPESCWSRLRQTETTNQDIPQFKKYAIH